MRSKVSSKSVLYKELYKNYLKSKKWKKRKNTYFKKYEKACLVCSSQNVILHHLSYGRLGREKDADLVPLCFEHHEEFHNMYGTKDLRKNTINFIILQRELLDFSEKVKTL